MQLGSGRGHFSRTKGMLLMMKRISEEDSRKECIYVRGILDISSVA